MDNAQKAQALIKAAAKLMTVDSKPASTEAQITMVNGVPMVPFKADGNSPAKVDNPNSKPSGIQPENVGLNGALTLDSISNMTPDQINDNWDAVSAVIQANGIDVAGSSQS